MQWVSLGVVAVYAFGGWKKISVDVALIDKSVHFSPMQYFYYFFFAFRDQMGPNKKQGLNKVSRKLKEK